MRIAHITATFPPYLAGTGHVAYYQARELARLGHEVHVYTAAVKAGGEYSAPGKVHLHRLPVLARAGNAPILPGLLGLPRYDIVHLHYPFISGAEFAWFACRRRKMPYVVNYHNDLIGVGLREKIFQAYTRAFGGLVLGQAALILAVTRDHALNCRATPIFQKHDRQIVELNNGVDVDHFNPRWDGGPARREIGLPDTTQVILFVGALDHAHHFKGVSLLLEAVERIDRQDIHLLLVGGGDLLEDYRAEASERKIAGQVTFTGGIPHAELPPYYAAADVVVLPSSPPESFGMVIIEAMACGKAVIGSRIPGVRSLISEGLDGLLIEPGNVVELASKLTSLLDRPAEERRAMGMAGRRKAEERFAWWSIARQLEGIYAGIGE